MSESLTAIASPADQKSYDSGLKAKKEAEKVTTSEISNPVAKFCGPMSSPKGAEAKAASTDSIAQDKQAGRYSIKPDLSDRRK